MMIVLSVIATLLLVVAMFAVPRIALSNCKKVAVAFVLVEVAIILFIVAGTR